MKWIKKKTTDAWKTSDIWREEMTGVAGMRQPPMYTVYGQSANGTTLAKDRVQQDEMTSRLKVWWRRQS
jgi:hypothetical protein